jgi:hypothetical protein
LNICVNHYSVPAVFPALQRAYINNIITSSVRYKNTIVAGLDPHGSVSFLPDPDLLQSSHKCTWIRIWIRRVPMDYLDNLSDLVENIYKYALRHYCAQQKGSEIARPTCSGPCKPDSRCRLSKAHI